LSAIWLQEGSGPAGRSVVARNPHESLACSRFVAVVTVEPVPHDGPPVPTPMIEPKVSSVPPAWSWE